MFCPECGTLSFVDPSGNIRCTNYKCGYEGPVGGRDGSGSIVIGSDGKEIDLTKTKSSTQSTDLKHLTEVQAPDVARGTLRVGDYRCPNAMKTASSLSYNRLGQATNLRRKYVPVRGAVIDSGNINEAMWGSGKDE